MLLSARETAERLGIKLDTLYAYVSRGLLRSVEVADSRERRYDADAVERFRAGRGRARGAPSQTEALMPVIGSAICLIENHRFYYRGKDALDLAETATLEEVAALLWEEEAPAPSRTGKAARVGSRSEAGAVIALIERTQIRLAELPVADYAALDLSRGGIVRTGGLILGELAAVIGNPARRPMLVHERLASLWRLDDSGEDLVRRALVLLADHELNASTFVARCVASTRANPLCGRLGGDRRAVGPTPRRGHGACRSAVSRGCRREEPAGADGRASCARRIPSGDGAAALSRG